MTDDQPNEEIPSNNQQDNTPTIRLDQFLKLANVVGSGGQAKLLIQSGEVSVNGQVETRRRKQLCPGDIVTLGDIELEVEQSPTEE